MKRLTYASLLLYGLMSFNTSSAAIWSWIDSLETCSSGFTYCYNYQFTIADWDEEDTTANPCYGQSACTIFISHRHNSAGTSGTGVTRSWGSGSYPFLLTASTMGDLGKRFKAVFSLPFSNAANHTANTVAVEECVGIFYARGTDLGNITSTTSNSAFSGYSLLPGSICGAAPAPSGKCDFTQDSLTIDHGTLSRKELEGHEATEQVNITCTTSQTLKLYIYAADKVLLRDDGSLYSELYMNNTTLGTDGFTLDVEENAVVDIKSKLRTNGTPEAGEFSGSTIMLITVE